MPTSTAYLFLEFAILIYAVGFGWEHLAATRLRRRRFWLGAASLAIVWFVLDEIAVRLGLWAFPQGGTLPVRLLSLPIEEYVLFFLHTVLCFLLVAQFSQPHRE